MIALMYSIMSIFIFCIAFFTEEQEKQFFYCTIAFLCLIFAEILKIKDKLNDK